MPKSSISFEKLEHEENTDHKIKVFASCGSQQPSYNFFDYLIVMQKYELLQDRLLEMIDALGKEETHFFTSLMLGTDYEAIEVLCSDLIKRIPEYGNIMSIRKQGQYE